MTEGDIRQRVRSALLEKRGSDLILSLIDEIVDLNIRIEAATRQIQALKSFEALQDHLITVDEAQRKDPRPATLTLDAAQLLDPSDGFHGLEYSQQGIPYRWTGPGREFSFSVFVARTQPIAVTLRVIRLMRPELQAEVVLVADGEPVTLKFVQEGDEWIARSVLPARADLRATHLTYVLAGVGSPPGTDDKRTLGIAFHKLEICPAHVVAPLSARDAMLNLAAPADNLLVLSKAVRPRKERAANGGGEAVTGLAD